MLRGGELFAVRSQLDSQIAGRVHERLNQYYRGLRVFGGQVVRQKESRRMITVVGALLTDIDLDIDGVDASVSQNWAAAKLSSRLHCFSRLRPQPGRGCRTLNTFVIKRR